MVGRPQIRVAIIYRHDLLGEGIARLLARDATLAVTRIPVADPAFARRALDPAPDVVIFEPDHVAEDLDLPARLPEAVLIDAVRGVTAGDRTLTGRLRARAVLAALEGMPGMRPPAGTAVR